MTEKTNIPQGYKDSPLGIIPKEWEVKRLGEICTHFKSGTTITAKEITEEGLYPVYGGNGLRGYSNTYTHNGDYILIGRQGALCGNINFVCGKSYISEHAIAVQTDEDMRWLRYKLENWNLNRFSESSAQPGLSVEKLVRYKLTVPTLNEQIGIATILQLWDTAIEKQSELIEKLKLRKRALMQQLLTGKKRLPGFCGEWKEVKLGDVFDERNETNVTPRESINVKFMSMLIQQPRVVYDFWTHSQGLVSDTLNCKYPDFCQVKVRIPTKQEQTAIASVLVKADKEIELANEKLASLQSQKRGLMQQLLTGKKRTINIE